MITAPDVIHTARLLLRKPVMADAQAIFTNYASNSDVTRFMAWPTHVSVEDTRGFLRLTQIDWQIHPASTYLIELDDNIIGSTGIHFGRPDTDNFSAETGYVFARSAWGKGYATEVLQAMVGLAASIHLQQLTAGCHPDNHASRHVLEKCGFVLAQEHGEQRVFPNAGSNGVTALQYQRNIT